MGKTAFIYTELSIVVASVYEIDSRTRADMSV